MQLSSSKQAVLRHFNLQELALLISEALAVESEHLDAIAATKPCPTETTLNPVIHSVVNPANRALTQAHFDRPTPTHDRLDASLLYQLSCEFGNLAFKYGETLKQVHPEATLDLPTVS